VTLDDVAREIVESAHPAAERKGIDLVLETDGRPVVEGDPRRLGQIVGNLVSNAVKYTPADGRVEVRSFSDNGSGVIEVSDTGIGIPVEEQDRLFQRFFRASTALENDIPGTGLGLAIAQSIAELHGGSLTCRSEDGSGSIFRLELPASK
jgi:signal transduction histidine kinase